MGPLLSDRTYPLMDLRVSGSAAKSESTQPSKTLRRPGPGSLIGYEFRELRESKCQISPQHSLHCDLLLLCSQIDAPPHSLHRDLILLCSQIDAPCSVVCVRPCPGSANRANYCDGVVTAVRNARGRKA
eukprot:1618499-Rhodomonas_salina.2